MTFIGGGSFFLFLSSLDNSTEQTRLETTVRSSKGGNEMLRNTSECNSKCQTTEEEWEKGFIFKSANKQDWYPI